MADRVIKTKIEIDGEKEYSAALKSIASDSKLVSSEMSRLDTEYEGQKNSLDYLTRKNELLSKAYASASSKVDVMAQRLDAARKAQSLYGEKVDATKQAISELTEKMSNLDTSTEDGAAAYQQAQEELARLNEELQTNEHTYAAAGDAVKSYETDLNKAYISKKKFGAQVAATQKYLEEAKTSTDHCATSIDEFGKRASSSASDAEDLNDAAAETGSTMESTSATTIAAGTLIADALKNAAEKALELVENLKDTGIEYQQSMHKMSAATGATGDELDRLDTISRAVFQDAFGDGLSDAYEGVIDVKNATGLMDAELQQAVEDGFALRDTFGFELQESARTADALVRNFGISAKKAYNIIAIGAQNGANKNGDLLDVLNEYSAQYVALGLNADEFIQSLISGAEQGVFSIDKVGDAVKEFNIRAKDGSDTSKQAFEALGMSAETMTARFAAGGQSARESLFEVVDALSAMEDPVQKNAAAVNLFGTMYEDLESNLLPILASMEDASGDTYDAMAQINEVRYNDLQTQWESVKRKIVVGTLPQLDTALTKVGDTLDSPRMTKSSERLSQSLGNLAESGGDLAEDVLPLLVDGLGLLADGADAAIDVLPNLAGALVTYKVAALAAKAAQGELNLTLAANPYALAAGVVAGLAVELGQAAIKANSMDSATKELRESMQATRDAAAAERDEISQNSDAALMLIGQIDQLSGVENKNEEQKARLKSMVLSLNQLVPDLGASYDDLSDSINMTTEEMRDFVLQGARLGAVESYQSELTDLYVDQSEALSNLTEKQEAADKAQQAYADGVKDLEKKLEAGTIDQQMYDSSVVVLKTDVENAAKAVDDASSAYDDANAAVAEAESNLTEYTDSLDTNTTATEDNTESTEDATEAATAAAEADEEYTEAVKDMTEVLNDAGIASGELAGQLVQQGISASDAESKIDGYKDTTLDAFSKIEAEQDISVKKMIETLNYNADVTQAWADNLAKLYSKAGDDSTREFISYLESLGPSYLSILQELNADTSGQLLGELVSAWSEGSSAAVQAALIAMGVLPEQAAEIAANAAQQSGAQFQQDTVAYGEAGDAAQKSYIESLAQITPAASKVLAALDSEISSKLSKIARSAQANGKAAGVYYGTSMQSGIDQSKAGIAGSASAAANAAYYAIYNKDWSGLGYNLSYGVARGIQSGSYLITRAAIQAVDAALSAAKRRAGVNSPSRVWRDDLGIYLSEGAAAGVERGTPVLLSQVRSTMDDALEQARVSLSEASSASIYDFVPTLEALQPVTITNTYNRTYNHVQHTSSVTEKTTDDLLQDILTELQNTGGMTASRIAKVLTPLIDDNLGAAYRRKGRF